MKETSSTNVTTDTQIIDNNPQSIETPPPIPLR